MINSAKPIKPRPELKGRSWFSCAQPMLRTDAEARHQLSYLLTRGNPAPSILAKPQGRTQADNEKCVGKPSNSRPEPIKTAAIEESVGGPITAQARQRMGATVGGQIDKIDIDRIAHPL